MWSAVLYGIGTGDGEIVTVALSQIGNVGGEPYWSWYGFNSRVEWCACFVSWCANECGYIDAGVIPKFAGCVWGLEWFRDHGLWQDRNYEPRPGDISSLIGTTKARQARRTENPTMWVSLRKSRMVSFIPWRAIPAIAAVKITMPLGL